MTRRPEGRGVRIGLGAVAVLLAAALLWAARRDASTGNEAHAYLTAPAVVADLEDAVLATGVLQAARQVSVGAQVSGQVKSLEVALGDRVAAGQAIAEIDSVPQRNALASAEAALATAQAQRRAQQATHVQTALTLARQREMRAADASSIADLEAAEAADALAVANVEAATAQVAQARLTADTARQNVAYTRISAPIAGLVVAIVTQQGQTVNSLQSAPTIVKIAQVDTMTVRTQISEADVTRLRPGQAIRFTILGEPERPYRATLRAIEPAPDSILADPAGTSSGGSGATAIYYNGLFDVPNPDGKLRIAMTAQVQIVREAVAGALTVPAAALGAHGADGRHEVRVVGADGRAVPRRVAVGLLTATTAQVTDGLVAGERVVVGDATRPGAP